MEHSTFPQEKIITPEALMKMIKPGDKIFITSGPAIPALTIQAITSSDRMQGLDLEIIQLFTVGNYFRKDIHGMQGYRVKTFANPPDEGCGKINSRGDLIPANVTEIPFLFSSHAIDIDIAIIAVSPPDENGFMSFGIAADVADKVIKQARLVVAEINRNIPFTYGSTIVKKEQFHYAVLSDLPLPEKKKMEVPLISDKIGFNISPLIKDGSTVVLHTDSMTDSVARHILSRKNIGILTNEVSDWIIPLAESGVISAERECYEGGKVSASYCYGSRKLYDYVNRNPLFGFFPISKLVEMSRFNDITDLISIKAVDKIDITAENIITCEGDSILSGYQNRFDFIPDISYSENCSVIMALPSVDAEGKSNILILQDHNIMHFRPTLGTVRYAATDFGVAALGGKTVRERAIAMIEIAHPDHREFLFAEAARLGYIYDDKIYKTIKADYPSQLEFNKNFDGDLELHIRPVRASDEDMMRKFFYRFSDESRYLRFFSYKAVMPHSLMQRYLNVDYKNIFSLIALHKEGIAERIIAEARYAIFPGQDKYEIAFLVDDEFQGRGIGTFMAGLLMDIARSRNIHRLNASVLARNSRMINIFNKLGVPFSKQIEEGVMELDFIL